MPTMMKASTTLAMSPTMIPTQVATPTLTARAWSFWARYSPAAASELVGTIDDDGVGMRVVDAGFDDRRAQQDVDALLREVAHYPLQLTLFHLAVADDDACFGQQFFELAAHVLDGVDFVVQEIHLSAAFEFAQQRFADDAVGEAGDEGLDRQALLWRRGDDREVAQAFERH